MFRITSHAFAALTFTFAATTHAAVIDFENDSAGNPLNVGDVITTQYSADGVTFSTDATLPGTSTVPADLMIFDTANPTGGDSDLATPGAGTNNNTALNNVLIISEDNDSGDPDDNAAGGNIFINFDFDVYFDEISFLDIEDNNSSVTLFDSAGSQIGSVFTISGLGDNSFVNVSTQTSGVRSATINLSTSGAITGFSFERSSVDVPAPNTMALIGLGMLALVALRRRDESDNESLDA